MIWFLIFLSKHFKLIKPWWVKYTLTENQKRIISSTRPYRRCIYIWIYLVVHTCIMCARTTVCVTCCRCGTCIPLSRYGPQFCDCNKSNLVDFEKHIVNGRRKPRKEVFSNFFQSSPFFALFVHYTYWTPCHATSLNEYNMIHEKHWN